MISKRCPSYHAFARKRCKCGVEILFYNNYPAICSYCNRKVYPTKECEFKEKLKLEMRKKKYE